MRLSTALSAFLLLAFAQSLAAAQVSNDEWQIEKVERIGGRPGNRVALIVYSARACPAEGKVDWDVVTPPGVSAIWANTTIKPRECDNRVWFPMTNTIAVVIAPDAPAGTGTIQVKLSWNGSSAVLPVEVLVGYVGKATLSGPVETVVPAGRSTPLEIKATVAANGPSRVLVTHDAPPGWIVDFETPATTRGAGAPEEVVLKAMVTRPDAKRDVLVRFTATPEHTESSVRGTSSTYDWAAIIPRATGPTAGPGGTDPDHGVILSAESEEGDGTPVWLWGLGLAGVAAVALWWSRK